MPTYTGTAGAVAREAAYLAAVDSLPSLLTANGGPWEIVQPYWPRTMATQKTGIYVLRTTLSDERASNARIRPSYEFNLKLVWPIRMTTSPLAESEQQNLDNAIDLLIQRVRGPMFDKSHGGAFLSVGEAPRVPGLRVTFDDPEITIPTQKALRAVVSYPADDNEVQD